VAEGETTAERVGAKAFAPSADGILASIHQASFVWDIAGDTMQWSDNASALMPDLSAAALLSASEFSRCIDIANRSLRFDAVFASARADQGEGVAYQVQYALVGGDRAAAVWVEETGRWFVGPDGKPAHAHGVVRIVTERHLRETQLTLLSHHDPLTGELNRNRLTEALGHALEDAGKFRNSFCFLVIAIDDLARLNEAFGFDVADEVIKIVAQRVHARMRGGDVLGRLSGNKFGVILKNCSMDDMNVAAGRLLAGIRDEVVPTSSGAVAISVSIGGILAPRHAQTADQAVSRALEALEQTRKRRGTFAAWRPSVEREAQRRANIRVTDEIVTALNDRRAAIVFEPVMTTGSRQLAFHECLVRLLADDGQLMLAPDVVPIAEKLGLIRLIDHRVLELVMAELAAAPDVHLSLNVSPATTGDADWWMNLEAALRTHPGAAERLTVEITETAAIQDIDQARGFVSRVRNLGSRIAIDDFGAGYTSFRNLRKLGVDLVKIDGAYVQNILHSADDRAFVQTLIELARRLDIKTVAEWVQDEESAALLESWGCDYLQGRLIGLATAVRPWRRAQLRQAATAE
jgi:diguanylate cyclase (GGDEF)-like protein